MKRLSITRTVIPLDYDKSTEGFNRWIINIRNQVHISDSAFNVESVIEETNKVLKFHKPTKR